MVSFKIFPALVLVLQLSSIHAQETINNVSHKPIPASYVGLNDAGSAWKRPWPTIEVSTIRLFDSAWTYLEPNKGLWTFEHLDQDVGEAEKRHQDLDLVLSFTPPWASARPTETGNGRTNGARAEPTDPKDWENYIRTVAKRYKGRVHTYELWNEPNLKSTYTGDIPQLVTLCRIAYQTLKQVDPMITVVSPSLAHNNASAAYLQSFLEQGGVKTFDVLGYHFYDNLSSPIIHPENIVGTTAALRRILTAAGASEKPIWNTESGYYIASAPEAKFHYSHYPAGVRVIGQFDAVQAIGRAYVLGWAGGLERFYWYAWGEPAYALVDDGGDTAKKATQAYALVRKWLVGSRYLDVHRSDTGLWVVRLEDPQRKIKLIVWTEAHPQDYVAPPELHLTQSQDLVSQTHPLDTGKVIAGPIPQLLF